LTGFRVRRDASGVSFHVRLTPKGGRDAIDGWSGTGPDAFLKARVRVAPEDGKANAALIVLLAKELGVAKSALAITAGQKARLKTIALTGDTTALAARLNGLGVAT
jgi:uncharacterized protein YggU (UPF0235/DUF167 family)